MVEGEWRLGLPVLGFGDADAFGSWMAAQPRTSPGAWLKLARKGSPFGGLGKAPAIDAALRHGWIDGQQHPYDDHCWLTRFTPRRAASRWSQVNRAWAERLIAEGRMLPAGMVEVERARSDGRWEAAYAPASTAEQSPEFRAALDAEPRAAAAFAALGRAERYAVLHRIAVLRTAAGRARRIATTVEALGR